MAVVDAHPTTEDERDTAFAARLRAATGVVHRAAERSRFLHALMRGALPREAYGRLVVQHLAIYEALEGPLDAMSSHPIAGGFVDPRVHRVDALRRDAEAVLGDDWLTRPEATVLPETTRYVERIRAVGAEWPGGWIAHHYVRYLGDLSGGQFLRRRIADAYGLDADNGAAFYAFPEITDPDGWKAAYRSRLDAAPWRPEEQVCIIDEAIGAFEANTAVFAALGEHC